MDSITSLGFILVILLHLVKIGYSTPNCIVSPTTASGKYAPQGPYCSGQLIFSDEFETLSDKWEHEQDLAGGSVSTNLYHFSLTRSLIHFNF